MTTSTTRRLNEAATHLSAILKRETKLLRTARPREIQALRQEKEVLANMYVSLMTELRERPDAASGFGDAELAQLRRTAHDLHTATEANAVALQAAMYANERLGETVAMAARDELAANHTYGRDGRMGGVGKKVNAPVSFNRSL